MSKGSKVVPVRMGEDLLEQVKAIVKRSAKTRFEGEWTVSEFVRAAVVDKLRHMERSRRPRRRVVAGPGGEPPLLDRATSACLESLKQHPR